MLFIKFIILIILIFFILYSSVYISSGNSWDEHWEITCGKLRPVNHLKRGLCSKEGLFQKNLYSMTRKRFFKELWYFPVISKFDVNSNPFLIFKRKPFYLNHYISLKFNKKKEKLIYSFFFKENITRHLLGYKAYKKIDKLYSKKLFINNLNLGFIKSPLVRTKNSYDPFFYSIFWNKHRSNCLYLDVFWLGYRITFK